ncbi:MAG: alpha/beta fold hydrolase [Anaerolineae bacterium]
MSFLHHRIRLIGCEFVLALLALAPFGTPDAGAAATQTLTSTARPAAAQRPGSDITIEETLNPGAGYDRYIVSYPSDGLKIYALMTVPREEMPATGFPVIVLNHGYIRPSDYVTTGSYVAHVDALARHGYIVFKSDYRGNGNSEGSSVRTRNSYVTDVLNAVEILKQHPYVDPDRMGMWGHSMGGYITVTAMLQSPDIKAGVIWAGTLRAFGQRIHSPACPRRCSFTTA